MKKATLKSMILNEIASMYRNPQYVEDIRGIQRRVLPSMEHRDLFRWIAAEAASFHVRINGNSIDHMTTEIISIVSRWQIQG